MPGLRVQPRTHCDPGQASHSSPPCGSSAPPQALNQGTVYAPQMMPGLMKVSEAWGSAILTEIPCKDFWGDGLVTLSLRNNTVLQDVLSRPQCTWGRFRQLSTIFISSFLKVVLFGNHGWLIRTECFGYSLLLKLKQQSQRDHLLVAKVFSPSKPQTWGRLSHWH